MTNSLTVSDDAVISKIYLIRGQKVMLDMDLSALYGVETRYLKRQVKRNIERFPEDFMFALAPEELENLRCQIGTSSWGGLRYAPMAFTEQGVAISVNIQVIRVSSRMRQLLITSKDILLKLEQIERKTDQHDDDFKVIFAYLKELLEPPPAEPVRKIGFKHAKDE